MRFRTCPILAPALLSLTVLAMLGDDLQAELPVTRVTSLFPLGAKSGSTVEVRITGGVELDESTGLRFSHAGIVGQRKTGTSPGEHLFDVTIAADVPAGCYDVCVRSDFGISNPRTFCVGSRTEVLEQEPNERSEAATAAAVGSSLNGRVAQATDVDCYRFHAVPGRKVIADCWASRIDSKLLPVLEVVDTAGRKLAHARAGRDDDATLVFDPPAEGDYVLRVFDQIYRGGMDFGYRIELHTDPYITTVLPVSGRAGTTSEFTLLGFNLPNGTDAGQRLGKLALEQRRAPIAIPADASDYDRVTRVRSVEAGGDSFSWALAEGAVQSNPVRLQISETDSSLEAEPNSSRDQAQRLTLPADLTGQFGSVGDVDAYSVDVKKGQTLWIEVFAERIGSSVDPQLVIEHRGLDDKGAEKITRISTQDDDSTNLAPVAFETMTDDPSFRYVAPGDGQCLVTVRDQYGQTRGDATLTYRLVVREPRPDFRLVAVPVQAGVGVSTPVTLRRGDSYGMALLAFRRDGFAGEIDVPEAWLASGLTFRPTVIPSGQTSAPLVLVSREDASAGAVLGSLRGRAVVAPDRTIERHVRPGVAVWSTAKVQARTVAAVARLGRDFPIAVMNETAPVEFRSPQLTLEVAQSRQVFLPLELVRREGGGNAATAVFDIANKSAGIETGEASFAADATKQSARLFIKPDAPAGTAMMAASAKTKVSYRRHPERAAAAQLALNESNLELKICQESLAAATRTVAEAEKALAAASKSTTDNAAEMESLDAARKTAAQRVTVASERLKEVETKQQAAAAAAKKAAELAAPKELEVEVVAPPIVVRIAPAPLKMTVKGALTLKPGGSASVDVTITRLNGFEGLVDLSLDAKELPLAITFDAVRIEAGATEASFVVKASESATAGDVANAVVRAICNGVLVDAPVSLKVMP